MKTLKILLVLAVLISSLPLFAQDAGTNAAPAIPEEARKHFVMGGTMFKEAKSADDLSQAVKEFSQAADAAPAWPEARYNLALAKEAAGDYSGAETDLKLYLQFKVTAGDARRAQDKIYVLEAKIAEAAKKQAEEQKEEAAKQEYQDKIGFLAGTWNCHSIIPFNGQLLEHDCKVIIKISGKVITFTDENSSKPFVKGMIEGDNYTSVKWMATDDTDDKNYALVDISPAEDIPIKVTIENVIPQIHWEQPAVMKGSTAASWSTRFGYNKFTLTK